ncbi:ionotropic receptor 93a isoform X1 [Anastrepha obliqua]|uniref:ionotropic receptor 93a isoform X1 n=1 Tax=Anastrepha obliqua TaxID=95512 RepID=UPI002409DBFF|nr:ionotropic receptor 93a isoform X1 [Anastrepha obliqua]
MRFHTSIWSIILPLCLFVLLPKNVEANDFSSFLTANASLAVVVDQEYMHRRGENILANFQKILGDIIRENLKNGGIEVKYYSWNQIALKKDFLAAITVTDCKSTWRFYESTQQASILLIAITDANCPRLPLNRAIMIPILDEGQELSQIIFDIKVQRILRWKTATLLIDQSILNDNPTLVESVVHESAKNHITPFSLLLYKIDDSLRSQRKRTAIRQTLTHFQDQAHTPRQFIVVSKFYEDIVETASSMELFHAYNQWAFFVMSEQKRSYDAMSVTQSLGEGANIAFILNSTTPTCISSINCTLAELSMAFVTSISRMIVEEQSIYGEISDEEWEAIRYTKQEKQDEILGYMKDYLRTNGKCGSCSYWKIETALSWGKSEEHRKYQSNKELRDTRNKNFEFIDVGYWTPILGFITQEVMFPHIEHFFRNVTLDILTVHSPPWQILEHDSSGKIVRHSGIVMEILKEMSRMLNFSYNLHEIKVTAVDLAGEDAQQIGNVTDDLLGSLTFNIPYRVIEVMQSSNFFMAALAATIDEPDKKSFNYTIPISVQTYALISRQPDEVSRIYLFTAPFTAEIWGCLVAIIIITAPVLYFINRFVPKDHLRINGLSTLNSCFWYIYGALLQQGGMYLPKADSGRLVIGVWWIVVIVLVTTYSGNLVAFLTFPQFQAGIDYFFQIFTSKDIQQFGLRNGSYFEKYSTQITTRDDFRNYVQRSIIYNNLQGEDINAVQQGKRINIDWRINLQLIIQRQFEKDKDCKFSLGRENFVDEQIGLLVPRGSPYLQLINDRIVRMFQMGFIERWHQINLPSMDKCGGHGGMRQIMNHKVNLNDMQGCFMVLLFGFMIALFVLFCEYWYRWYFVERKKAAFAY